MENYHNNQNPNYETTHNYEPRSNWTDLLSLEQRKFKIIEENKLTQDRNRITTELPHKNMQFQKIANSFDYVDEEPK